MHKKPIILLVLAIAVGFSDAIFKHLALRFLPSEQSAVLKPIITLAVHRNPGIAFDIPLPLVIVLPITLGLIAGLGYLALKRWHTQRIQAILAFTAIIGAIGNGFDRFINGFTTDYLILFKTSAINLSDVLILIGVLGFVWYDKHLPNPDQQQTTSQDS